MFVTRKVLLLLLVALLGLFILVVAWTKSAKETEPSSEAQSTKSFHSSLPSPQSNSDSQSDATNIRLKPDNRLLLAFEELVKFSGQTIEQGAKAEVLEDLWKITVNGEQVALLPERPGFKTLDRALISWAQQRIAERLLDSSPNPALNEQSLRLLAEQAKNADLAGIIALLAYLSRNQSAGGYSVGELDLQGELYTLLAMRNFDLLRLNDRVYGRAWALHAILAGRKDAISRDWNCLLLNILDYSNSARECASKLPETSWVRAAVFRNIDSLKNFSMQNNQARYQWLDSMRSVDQISEMAEGINAQIMTKPEFNTAMVRSPELFFLKGQTADVATAQDQSEFNMSLLISHLEVALKDALAETPGTNPEKEVTDNLNSMEVLDAGKFIIRLDMNLQALSLELTGSALDRSVFTEFYRAAAYSTLYVQASLLSSHSAASSSLSSFLASMKDVDTPEMVGLKTWLQLQIKQGDEVATHEQMFAALNSPMIPLGMPLRSLCQATQPFFQSGDLLMNNLAHAVIQRLDSRPDDVAFAAETLYRSAFDLRNAETLYTYLLTESAPTHMLTNIWYLGFVGKDREQRELQDQVTSLKGRARILAQRLGDPAEDFKRIEAEVLKFSAKYPNEWSIVEPLISNYLEKKLFRKVQETTEQWLKKRTEQSRNDDFILASVSLSRALYEQGKYGPGLKAVESLVDNGSFEAVQLAAWNFEKLNKSPKAEELLKQAVERSPSDVRAYLELAGIYWRRSENKKALEILVKAQLGSEQWQKDIPTILLASFPESKDRELRQALDDLNTIVSSSDSLATTSIGIFKAGRYETAKWLISSLRSLDSRSITFRVQAFKEIKEKEGAEAAIIWLQQQIPESARNLASSFFFDEREFELLWEMIPNPESGQKAIPVWLTRAAAYSLEPERLAIYQNGLKAYFRESNRINDPAYRLGRILLGFEDLKSADTFLGSSPDRGYAIQAAYYLAVRGIARRNFAEAYRLLRYVRFYASERMPEYRWALSTLNNWKKSGLNLKTLEARYIY